MNTKETIFILSKHYIPQEVDDENDTYIRPSYPQFALNKSKIAYSTSLENAEKAMRLYISENEDEEQVYGRIIYCYIINELPLDTLLWDYCEIVSRRTYSSDGNLIDACLVSELNVWRKKTDCTTINELQRKGMFVGRRPENIRFKEGDIVEVFGEFRVWNMVQLGIIIDTPSTLQERLGWDTSFDAEIHPDNIHRPGDDSDDRYKILTGEEVYNFKKGDDAEECYDSWSNCTYVMSPRLPVPEELRQNLVTAHHAMTWHPVIRRYIQQIDSAQLKLLNNFYCQGKEIDKERIKALLEEMQIPYNGSPKTGETVDCGISDEDMPAYCMQKVKEYAGNEECCAALCYGLAEYFEGVEW
ncbi:MAG: hypothetical protein LBK97_00285 [Prevotellaceae bacterium]|jgi:hypothetical protein|nr:hypothetical protein [Prevotellaceae bacterium]